MSFVEALGIRKGITAIIGSGGKTSLLYALAEELRGSVILCTTTQIFPPEHIPVVQRVQQVQGIVCVGTPCPNGKLGTPQQTIEQLAEIADFVLVEADGSKHLPLKAHASYEPVIPENCKQVILVVGASGLNRPIGETVHRSEIFYALTGSEIATPEAVAVALQKEHYGNRVFINQADAAPEEAQTLAKLLPSPVCVGSVKEGEILCLY